MGNRNPDLAAATAGLASLTEAAALPTCRPNWSQWR